MNPLRLFFVGLLALATLQAPCDAAPLPSSGTVEVLFSPDGGATAAIVREIDSARTEILVQAYSFTSAPIAKALVKAKRRGVRIEAVLDKSNQTGKYSGATFISNAGIPVWIDSQHQIAHNKIIILDQQTLITGSFNFSKAAEEKNAENLLVLKGNVALLRKYISNYNEHKGHSAPFR